jgi:anti-sigma regulatory factor (Ser/Thr protein kinase)
MNRRDQILKIMRLRGSVKAPKLAKELGLSRQKTTLHLSRLAKEGLIHKEGSTRGSVYFIADKKKKVPQTQISLIKNLKNLEEDRVYAELELRFGLKKLPINVQNIIFYAFTEMLNNAIDHSRSKKALIEVGVGADNITFQIKDGGIGLFHNIQKTFRLKDEYEALEHVVKGKQTTAPERHSGQGLFFTSRIADLFKIRSHKIEYTREENTGDIRVADIRNVKGTEIHFQLKKRSKKIINDLFRKYSADPEQYEFDKTHVRVNLTGESNLVARSQAKRILLGLEKYKVITLDFKKVREVGQGFIDEIFHVFRTRYPASRIEYMNANAAVQFMINRNTR